MILNSVESTQVVLHICSQYDGIIYLTVHVAVFYNVIVPQKKIYFRTIRITYNINSYFRVLFLINS